jgi:hypothetical protein
MPSDPGHGGNSASPSPIADLLAFTAEFDRRSEEWRGQLKAILRQHEDLESGHASALARALRSAIDPRLGGSASAKGRVVNLPGLVKAYERGLVEWALAAAHGCQKDAAGLLGLSATTLNEKMKRFGLRPQGHRPVPPGTRAFSSSNQSGL